LSPLERRKTSIFNEYLDLLWRDIDEW
jgi:hypothetical protein